MLKTQTRTITATRMEVIIIPIQTEVHITTPAPVARDKFRTLPRLLKGRAGRVSKGRISVFENLR